jgi:TonB family protein
MKHRIAFSSFMILFFLTPTLATQNGVIKQAAKTQAEQPTVKFAIAPIFIPWKFDDVGTGKVIVEVKVNAAGEVTAAKSIEGSPDFPWGDLSFVETAKLWCFTPAMTGIQERVLRLTFVLRLMPKGTPWQELAPRYTAPYEMEVRHEVFETDKTPHPSMLIVPKATRKRP